MSILKFTKFRKRYLRGKLLTRRSSSREKLIPWVHDDTFDDPLLSIPIGAFSYKETCFAPEDFLFSYILKLHLIHWNSSTYNTLEEAMGKPHGIAIIALFIQVGREHTGLRTFTDYLEAVQYKGRTLGVTTPFHPSCLLPDPQLRDFWTYQGSLTTPPCYERVTWILFRYPLTISISQMEEFRRLKNHVKGDFSFRGEEGLLVDNFRPTQPLNDRTIEASFQ
nr:carbonic anhydrase-related protein-like [Lytechinus pictus]